MNILALLLLIASSSPSVNEKIIITLSNKYGVDSAKMVRIAQCESGLRHEIENTEENDDGTQKSSSSGLFQITSPTWKDFKCMGDKKDAFDGTLCAIKIATTTQSFSRWNESKACWNKPQDGS